jgi:hypothetical protein
MGERIKNIETIEIAILQNHGEVATAQALTVSASAYIRTPIKSPSWLRF